MAAKESGQPLFGLATNFSPSEASIRQQLEKILTSPQFVNSPNLHNFLRFIVEKTLAGESTDIKGYTVATQVLGRKPDFDPNLDPIVRILAGRLRRALSSTSGCRGRATRWSSMCPRALMCPYFASLQGRRAPALSFLGFTKRQFSLSLQAPRWRLCPCST